MQNQARRRKKRRRGSIDYPLAFFMILWGVAKLTHMALLHPFPKRMHGVVNAALAILPVVILTVVVLAYTLRPNAVAIYIDGINIGHARISPAYIDNGYMLTHSVSRLESRLGTRIAVNSTVYVAPGRIQADSLSFDGLIALVMDNLDFDIYATALYVNGSHVLYLPSEYMLNGLLYYIGGGGEFAEELEFVSRYAHSQEVHDFASGLELLTWPHIVTESYMVRSGDSLSTIAANHGISLSHLLSTNPHINEHSTIFVGDRLIINRPRPIIELRR